jgi:transcription elongation factor Elf1
MRSLLNILYGRKMNKAQPDETSTRGHCPTCGANKIAHIQATEKRGSSHEDMSFWENHYILECGGCGCVYHQIVTWNTEEIEYFENGQCRAVSTVTHWPIPVHRPRPDWHFELMVTDSLLYHITCEVYEALNHNIRVLAAIGMRTTIDRATELLGIKPNLTFTRKLDELLIKGKIGKDEREHLSVLIDAGSAAAHRGWRPSMDELDLLMPILEVFLNRNFLMPKQMEILKNSVPQKPSKK